MTLVLSDYILECVLVKNGRCLSLWRRKNKMGIIPPYLIYLIIERNFVSWVDGVTPFDIIISHK